MPSQPVSLRPARSGESWSQSRSQGLDGHQRCGFASPVFRFPFQRMIVRGCPSGVIQLSRDPTGSSAGFPLAPRAAAGGVAVHDCCTESAASRLTHGARCQPTVRPSVVRLGMDQVGAAARGCTTVPVRESQSLAAAVAVSRLRPHRASDRTIVCHSRSDMQCRQLGGCIVTWCPELAA